MKKFLINLVGTDFVLGHLAQIIAGVLRSVGNNFDADILLYDLGYKIRNILPGNVVEEYAAELIGSFKMGLLGESFDPEKIVKEDEEKEEESGN